MRCALALHDLTGQALQPFLSTKSPSPTLRAAWASWDRLPDEATIDTLRVYTDGSAQIVNGAALAGYGFVCLSESRKANGVELAFIGIGFAPVVVDAGSPGFCGARRRTAPTAELSAACAVLSAVGALEAVPARVAFFVDCLYVVGLIEGRVRASANVELVYRTRAALYYLGRRTPVGAFHVRGHSGDPGNELADIAADAGAAATGSEAARLLGKPRPPLAAQVISLHSLVFWQGVLESPDPADPTEEADTVGGTRGTTADSDAAHDVTFASANVLSLKPEAAGDAVAHVGVPRVSARRLDLAAQFARAGFDVVGLQETRTLPSERLPSGSYVAWGSGAEGGQGGIELWLHRKLVDLGAEVYPVHADARRLLVRVLFGRSAWLLVVAHAPHAGTEGDELLEWWVRTSALVHEHERAGDAIVTLVDANARVGSEVSDFVGPSAAEQQNGTGAHFHEYLASVKSLVPATFDCFGDPGAPRSAGAGTWRACNGKWHRIDYVAVPLGWASGVVRAWTDAQVHLSLGSEVDHRAVAATVRLAILPPGRADVSRAPAKWADRRALRDQAVRAAIEAEWLDVPDLPPTLSIDAAEAALSRLSRQVFARRCPPGAPCPRKDWLSAGSQEALALHAQVRSAHFGGRRRAHRARARYFLVAWRAVTRNFPPRPSHGDVVRLGAAAAAHDEAITQAAWTTGPLAAAARQAQRSVRRDRAQWLLRQADELDAAAQRGDHTGVWSTVRRLTGKRARPTMRALSVVRRADGSVASSREEVAQLWSATFVAEFGGFCEDFEQSCFAHQVAEELDGAPLPAAVAPPGDLIRSKLTDAVAAAKAGRAAGPDGVPPELMKASGSGYVRVLAGLVERCFVARVPLTWRGGNMVPVPKKSHLPMQAGNVRGVLCSPCPGKALAACVRAELAPYLAVAAGESQQGGIRGRSVEFASHVVRTYLAHSRAANRSVALLFGDLRAAFYSVLPELVLGALLPADSRRDLFVRLGLGDATVAKYLECLAEGNFELARLGVPEAWRRVAADWHRANWFQVSDLRKVIRANIGTRPGDPLADVIFAFAFAKFSRELFASLSEAGLVDAVPMRGAAIWPQPGDPLTEIEVEAPTFMDDFCVMISSTAVRLLDDLALAASLTMRLAREHGLNLNFKEGKTEAIVAFAGKGAIEARRRLARLPIGGEGAAQAPLLPLPDGGHLRLVSRYRHLGVSTTASSSPSAAVAAATAGARMAARALAQQVLRRRGLPVSVRVRVAEACCLSRALYAAGTWPRLPPAVARRLAGACEAPFAVIASSLRASANHSAPRLSHAEARWVLAIPSWRARLAAARLRYAARVARGGPLLLHALVQGPGGDAWRGAILDDLEWFRSLLPDRVESLPAPRANPAAWEAMWCAAPAGWGSLLARFLRRAGTLDADCAPGEDSEGPTSDGEGDIMCMACGQLFRTRAACATHRARVHAYRNPLGERVACSTCATCGVDFRSRPRLLRHLGRVEACARAILATPPLATEVVAAARAADAAWQRACRREGLHPLAGLPAIRR